MSRLSTASLAELSPLRKLLIAVLLAVVLAQAAAMALLAQSQVQKAALREAVESTASHAIAKQSATPPTERVGTTQVRYMSPR